MHIVAKIFFPVRFALGEKYFVNISKPRNLLFFFKFMNSTDKNSSGSGKRHNLNLTSTALTKEFFFTAKIGSERKNLVNVSMLHVRNNNCNEMLILTLDAKRS